MRTDCGDVAVNSFTQTMHLSAAASKDHDVVGIGEVGQLDVGSSVNLWVILQSFAKNLVDNVIDERRGENTSFSNAGANLIALRVPAPHLLQFVSLVDA